VFSEVLSGLMSGLRTKKVVVAKPTVTRFILGFCPDLTDPNATCIEMGMFSIKGEEFRSFVWWVDYRGLGLDPLTEGIFRMWPDSMRHLVSQWQSFKARPIPGHLKIGDPENIEEYLVTTLSRSSISIMRVEYEEAAAA